jgi:hypothetical protein
MRRGFFAAAHQMKQLLRGRVIATVAALLCHRAADNRACGLRRFWLIDPQFRSAVTPNQTLNDRLASFAGRSFIANVDVASAHGRYPPLKSLRQRTTAQKSCTGV